MSKSAFRSPVTKKICDMIDDVDRLPFGDVSKHLDRIAGHALRSDSMVKEMVLTLEQCREFMTYSTQAAANRAIERIDNILREAKAEV